MSIINDVTNNNEDEQTHVTYKLLIISNQQATSSKPVQLKCQLDNCCYHISRVYVIWWFLSNKSGLIENNDIWPSYGPKWP